MFVDGHTDLYQPEANINGEAASSDLAFATGRGPGDSARRRELLVGFEDLLAWATAADRGDD